MKVNVNLITSIKIIKINLELEKWFQGEASNIKIEIHKVNKIKLIVKEDENLLYTTSSEIKTHKFKLLNHKKKFNVIKVSNMFILLIFLFKILININISIISYNLENLQFSVLIY